MRTNYICDFCGNPLNQLRRIQINNWNDKEHKDCFETMIEADLCQKCSLKFEQEIRRRVKQANQDKLEGKD